MSDEPKNQRSLADAELEREIRKERTFSIEEAIGRMAGPGSMKGASPITRKQQAEAEIDNWLRLHLPVGVDILQVVLLRQIGQSETLISGYDQPLVVLGGYCQRLIGSEPLLSELVREADVEWGRVFDERPHFDQQGSPPHPDDPYTIESVRNVLCGVVKELACT
jgi:hypothetical protein